MPLIEELPVTAGAHTRTSHGWAYVPDVRFDASRTAVGASAPRNKRLAREATRHAGVGRDVTVKQAKAVAARIADLDKENWKDAAPIPVPTATVTKTKGKVTPNVRRILTSGRNFGHWLAAEEAELQSSQSNTYASTSTATLSRRADQRGQSVAPRPSDSAKAMPPPPRPGAGPTPAARPTTPSSTAAATPTPTTQSQAASTPSTSSKVDPLLVSHVPKPPSERVMSILLSEPPLSYNAARGGPSKLGVPPRRFCSMCGYWGKIKCRKCGDRTCGRMECYRGHEETCQVGW